MIIEQNVSHASNSSHNSVLMKQFEQMSLKEQQRINAKLGVSNMPAAEMAYKPAMKIEFDVVCENAKRPTNPFQDEDERPSKVLRNFNKGSLNRRILTKNFVIEFDSINAVRE